MIETKRLILKPLSAEFVFMVNLMKMVKLKLDKE